MVTAGTPDGPTLGRIAYEERLRIKGERLHYAPQPDYDALSDDLRAEWEAAGAVVGATAIARLGQPAELASAMRENVRLRKQLAALEPKAAPGNAEVAYEQWIEHRNPGDVGSRAGFVAGWQAGPSSSRCSCGTGLTSARSPTSSAARISPAGRREEGFNCILAEKDPASAELIKVRLSKPIQPLMFGEAG